MDDSGVIRINFDDSKNKINSKSNNVKQERKTEQKARTTETSNIEPETEEESKSYLKNLKEFIKTDNFEKFCSKWEKKTGYSKKKIAETMFQRILGTIGDFSCIGCDTFESIVHKFISVLSYILKLGITIITKIAKAAFRIITLNYTRG